jgi:hypothetical protein
MTHICYVPKKFGPERSRLIDLANGVIADYEGTGLTLTLRQLYYQLVARGHIPNNLQSYDRLGSTINDARLAGLVSWHAIEDRTRNLITPPHWENPAAILSAARHGYAIDKWENQPCHIEVWVEKEALAGVVAQIAKPLDISHFACRGYVSQSEVWEAGQRFKRLRDEHGKQCIVLHLGDHDPSGIDMTRDNLDRLEMLSEGPVIVERLALNMGQIEQYDPPPNPAKMSDSRASDYVARYGSESWELDALEPTVIQALITKAVEYYRVQALWEEALKQEASDQRLLDRMIDSLRD